MYLHKYKQNVCVSGGVSGVENGALTPQVFGIFYDADLLLRSLPDTSMSYIHAEELKKFTCELLVSSEELPLNKRAKASVEPSTETKQAESKEKAKKEKGEKKEKSKTNKENTKPKSEKAKGEKSKETNTKKPVPAVFASLTNLLPKPLVITPTVS